MRIVKQDAALVERLRASQIPLTVCPLSNVRLKVVEQMTDHPLPQIIEQGLKVTLNSDDPAYFRAYLNENFEALVDEAAFTEAEVLQLVRNAFTVSWLPETRKTDYLARVDAASRSAVAH